MSTGLAYIIFGAANFFGSQPVANTSLSGSVSSTIEVALQHRATRHGYTYTPGVGTYKVHTTPSTWNLARRNCLEEGGHLAIINSADEANTIAKMLKGLNSQWGYVGFHDLYQVEDYATIHGESLASTGFEKWHTGEPNNDGGKEHCGGLMSDGTLAIVLTLPTPFVNYLTISWFGYSIRHLRNRRRLPCSSILLEMIILVPRE